MGNCVCSRVKEENESYYDDDYFDEIALGEIMNDYISPHRPQTADLISELDDDDDDDYYDDDDEDDGGGSDILRDISFENDSNISKLENIFVGEELCGICAFNYDEDKHVPRILPCGHTFCYYCIRKMARRYKYKLLKCPLDRKRHILRQRHMDQILFGEQSSSTVSIASGSIDLVLDLDLFLQPDVDSEDDTEDQFIGIHTDTSSNEESEGNFRNLNIISANYDTSESNSQIPDNFSAKTGEMTLKNVELEYTDSDKNESDTGALHANQQQSSMFYHKEEQSRREVYDGDDLDLFYLRRKKWRENKTDLSKTDQDDIYADERSVRSYNWVEPDYD